MVSQRVTSDKARDYNEPHRGSILGAQHRRPHDAKRTR